MSNVRVLDPLPQMCDLLPNGAVVVEAAEGAETGVVLARTTGSQPWATWKYRKGDWRTTGSGRYFDTLSEAVDDFDARKPASR